MNYTKMPISPDAKNVWGHYRRVLARDMTIKNEEVSNVEKKKEMFVNLLIPKIVVNVEIDVGRHGTPYRLNTR